METIKYDSKSVGSISSNKPVVYLTKTASGKNNYIGTAKRGRAADRIAEHLGIIPGTQVKIKQVSSIDEARKIEAKLIAKAQPKYNKQGK